MDMLPQSFVADVNSSDSEDSKNLELIESGQIFTLKPNDYQ